MVKLSNRGFSVWFEHAGVSVMLGPGTYSDHYNAPFYDPKGLVGLPVEVPAELASETAEIAIVLRHSESRISSLITQQWDPEAFGGVIGYASAAQVASAIAWAQAYVPAPSGLAPTLSA